MSWWGSERFVTGREQTSLLALSVHQYPATAGNYQQCTNVPPRPLFMSSWLTVCWHRDCCGSVKNMSSYPLWKWREARGSYLHWDFNVFNLNWTQRAFQRYACQHSIPRYPREQDLGLSKLSEVSQMGLTWCRFGEKQSESSEVPGSRCVGCFWGGWRMPFPRVAGQELMVCGHVRVPGKAAGAGSQVTGGLGCKRSPLCHIFPTLQNFVARLGSMPFIGFLFPCFVIVCSHVGFDLVSFPYTGTWRTFLYFLASF